jgi:hypothetical protein
VIYSIQQFSKAFLPIFNNQSFNITFLIGLFAKAFSPISNKELFMVTSLIPFSKKAFSPISLIFLPFILSGITIFCAFHI